MNEAFFISLVQSFGYLGVFAVGFISSASILLPVPGWLVIFGLGGAFNPLLVGVFAGIGAGFGELIGYAVGFGGWKLAKSRNRHGWLEKISKRYERHMFWLVFVFAATPLPDDIVGLIAGSLKYDMKKFLAASILGKMVISIIIAYAGYASLGWLASFL